MEAFINWKRECGALAIKDYIEGPSEKKWFRIYIEKFSSLINESSVN